MVTASKGIHFTTLRPASSTTVMRAKNFPFRRQSPRIGCLRLSRTLVYLYRHEFELETVARWVAERCMRQHCRKCQTVFMDTVQVLDNQWADVAELADALDSKSSTRESVWVRPPPSAPLITPRRKAIGAFIYRIRINMTG